VVSLTTVKAPVLTDKSAPSPETRVFAARLDYKMRTAGRPGPDVAETLLAFLEGLVKDGAPVSAKSLAEAAEYAVECGMTP
jgi:hypothetical protein